MGRLVQPEQLNNPVFNPIEFDGIKKRASLYSFTLTSKPQIKRSSVNSSLKNLQGK